MTGFISGLIMWLISFAVIDIINRKYKFIDSWVEKKIKEDKRIELEIEDAKKERELTRKQLEEIKKKFN